MGCWRTAVCAATMLWIAAPASAQSVADFYQGKQITLIVGAASGGGYDAQARLLARHIGKHIPGNPTVVVQNMPGAGSLQATNHLYNIAAKDGTTFGLIQRDMLVAKAMNAPGVRFDVEKFNWVGNLASEIGIVTAWHTSPIKTTEDLFNKEMIVGGTGTTIDTETSPRLMNSLIGTKFRVVSGYTGTAQVLLAMERGEVMGLGDWSLSNIRSRNAQMLQDGKIRLLMQTALKKSPDLPDVPLILDFAKTGRSWRCSCRRSRPRDRFSLRPASRLTASRRCAMHSWRQRLTRSSYRMPKSHGLKSVHPRGKSWRRPWPASPTYRKP